MVRTRTVTARPLLRLSCSLLCRCNSSGRTRRKLQAAIDSSRGLRDRMLPPSRAGEVAKPRGPVVFIATEGLTRDRGVSIFDSIVLTPDEGIVLRALHTIEPAIERIASVGTNKRSPWR